MKAKEYTITTDVGASIVINVKFVWIIHFIMFTIDVKPFSSCVDGNKQKPK